MEHVSVPKKYLTASHGGVGTHSIARFICGECGLNYVPVRHNRKPPAVGSVLRGYGRKRSQPPIVLNSDDDIRILYVWGDPRDVVCSFWHRHGPGNAGIRLHCSNVQGNKRLIDTKISFAKYMARGVDAFGLEEHVRNWTSPDMKYHPYRIAAVDYSKMYDEGVKVEICRFFGVSPDNYPEKKQRRTNWRKESKRTRARLTKMFSSLLEYECRLKPFMAINYEL